MKAKIFVGGKETGKSRVAKMISEFVGNDSTVFLTAYKRKQLGTFDFSSIEEKTNMLIIDDCPKDFDYSYFLTNDTDKIIIDVNKKCKKPEKIMIPYLILITNELNEEWTYSLKFNRMFDVVRFPLNNMVL
jgi:hypothetical protein